MTPDIRKELIENLTVSVETAGKAFGLSRGSAYEACKTGDIPSIRIGGRIAVPTAALRKMLGIEDKAFA
jgi:hypothetical protein